MSTLTSVPDSPAVHPPIARGETDLAGRLEALNLLSRALNVATSSLELFQLLARHTPEIVPAERSSVALIDASGTHLEVLALKGDGGVLPVGVRFPLAGSGIGQALVNNAPLITDDAGHSPYFDHQGIANQGLRSIINAPLRAGGRQIGALNVAVPQAGRYGRQEADLLDQIAMQTAFRLVSLDALEQTRASLVESEVLRQRLDALNTASVGVSKAQTELEAFDVLAGMLPGILPADRVSWVTLSQDRRSLDVRALGGMAGALGPATQLPVEGSRLIETIESLRGYVVDDFTLETSVEAALLVQTGILSAVSVPVIARGECLGVLNVGSRNLRAFTARDEQFVMHAATILAWTVSNLRLIAALRQSHDQLEQRVRARTEELRATNSRLTAEIAEREAVQKHLAQARDDAEAANRAKSEFLSNISHELRTPMHVIMSFTGLGLERLDQVNADKLRGYLLKIQSSGARLTELIDNLLDLARLEAGKLKLELRPVSIIDVLRQALDEVSVLADRKPVRLDMPAPHSAVVQADMQWLRRVFSNVLRNAIQYSPAGGHVRISLQQPCARANGVVSAAGDSWRISVCDEGPGIPPTELDTIFDKFAQSSKTNTGAGGTGLGLSIAREIMHLHGGEIRAENNALAGATFHLTLPLATAY